MRSARIGNSTQSPRQTRSDLIDPFSSVRSVEPGERAATLDGGGRLTGSSRIQLRPNHHGPDSLSGYDHGHGVDIQTHAADHDADDDERSNDTAIGGNPTAEASVAQRRNGPQNDREGRSNGVDARESLIDLKNAVDDDPPLLSGGRDVEDHVAHNAGDDESADRGGDESGYAGEAIGNDRREGDAVERSNATSEAAPPEEQHHEAHHCQRVRGGGSDR